MVFALFAMPFLTVSLESKSREEDGGEENNRAGFTETD
jgi:hypothetical protein